MAGPVPRSMMQKDDGRASLSPVTAIRAFRSASAAVSDQGDGGRALSALAKALIPDVADFAAVFVRGAGERIRLRSHAPRDALVSAAGSPFRRAAGRLARASVRRGVTLALPQPAPGRADAGVFAPEEGGEASDRGAALVSLPLHQENECVGALVLARVDGVYVAEDVWLLMDLGDRISQGLENRRLTREVSAARQAKADFLAVVNHELRTPLTAIVGYADLLEAGIPGPTTPRQRLQLGRIKESAWDLLELIESILTYARYEGERPELHIEPAAPAALLDAAIRLVEGAAAEKGLEIEVDMEEPLPAFPTDREKARKILFQLLSNAVKFTATGNVRVEVRATPEWLSFTVADTGSGIREEERSAIFEPFWQGERPETRTTRGAGMGLPLAQRLTQILGGQMEVASAPGSGSTFTVRLPRAGPRRHVL